MVKHVLLNDVSERRLVLGGRETTIREMLETLSAHAGRRYLGWINLDPLLEVVAIAFRNKMNAWDRFCMRYRHFRYRVVSPETFGMASAYPTLKDILKGV